MSCAYVVPLIISYFAIRNDIKKGIFKPNGSYILMVTLPIVNIVVTILFILDFIVNNSEKIAHKFFFIKDNNK